MQVTIRVATAPDLDRLQDIENAADRLFLDRFSPKVWETAPTGQARSADPGFILVAVDCDEVVGFAHVLEVGGGAHLEQLAVQPQSARRGYGRALVEAALHEAGRRGYLLMTLRTFADVPWNAPFYSSLGFAVTEPQTEFLRSLIGQEAHLGIDHYGRRVQMTAPTATPAHDGSLCSPDGQMSPPFRSHLSVRCAQPDPPSSKT